MSATDYRHIVDVGDNPIIGVECTDSIHVRLDLFGMSNVTLDAAGTRELVAALAEAVGNIRG